MKTEKRNGWWWVPTLYYAEGIPYIIAMSVSVVMYQRMGISNTAIAFWTSILYLPWTIKPLWSPLIDVYSTKRNWILWMQLSLSGAFIVTGFMLSISWFLPASLILLWITAISSATHDIAADGFYMLGLNTHQQTWFVGIRSTFYRLAMITASGLIVMLAGFIESRTGLEPVSVQVRIIPSAQGKPQCAEPLTETGSTGSKPEIVVSPSRLDIARNLLENQGQDSMRLYIALSAPPPGKEKIFVRFGRKSGDKNIFLTEEMRIEFNGENWNRPVEVFIKINPAVSASSQAVFEATAGNTAFSWMAAFWVLGIMFLVLALYHKFLLPYPVTDTAVREYKNIMSANLDVFRSYFTKPGIVGIIFFLLFYRFAESQLVKLAAPFLLDAQEAGGLALSTSQVGLAYGTIGILALVIGGLSGGFLASRQGLQKWLWPMALFINLPDLVYVYLAYSQPQNFYIICSAVAIEQFGYGFGFTAYMLVMIYAAEGKYKTAHYAISTAFMALGMMIPGLISGYVQSILGYRHFFIYVVLATIPSFIVLKLVRIDPEFGKKKN
jgi:MFS transporter, PAT family, beta-lactamase induction signal transducer AmpG